MMSKLILLVYTSWKQLKFLKGFSLNDTLKKKSLLLISKFTKNKPIMTLT